MLLIWIVLFALAAVVTVVLRALGVAGIAFVVVAGWLVYSIMSGNLADAWSAVLLIAAVVTAFVLVVRHA